MNQILTLLRPKLQATRNQLVNHGQSSRRGQALAIGAFSLIVMVGLFFGTQWGLDQLLSIPLLVYVPPSIPLGLMLMMLMFMTSLTALASALGSFYLADDLETILASPVSSFSLFAARLIYVMCTVAWMPFVFIFPVLAAMALTYDLSGWFIPVAVATLLPFFLIPSALGTLAATLFMATIDQRRAKLIVRLTAATALVALLYIFNSLVGAVSSTTSEGQLVNLLSALSISQSPWMPSTWAASILSETLAPQGERIGPRLVLLYSSALALCGLAYTSLHLLHARGFSQALSRRDTSRQRARATLARDLQSLPTSLALIQKDLRTLTRDVAQSTQIIFLIGLYLLYMSNLQNFVMIDAFAQNSRVNWQQAFFIIHTAITAFFTSAVCTRLVFASLSLEGKNIWILQTAPLRFPDVLRAKFVGWFIPVSVVSSLLFAVGTHVLVGRWEITALFATLSFFVSYGIVGMGIGLGAYFADFSWEHPSQLALSIGSLVYMLSSSLLVLFNMFPMGVLLQILLAKNYTTGHFALTMFVALAMACGNIVVAKMTMRLGERSPAVFE